MIRLIVLVAHMVILVLLLVSLLVGCGTTLHHELLLDIGRTLA
jgi:hypothetical protein